MQRRPDGRIMASSSSTPSNGPSLLRIRTRDDEGTLVIVSGAIEFRAKRIHFERQQHFRLDDHLFQLDLAVHSRRMPELANILRELRVGIAALIEELQTFYSHDDNHQMYITFDDAHFSRGGLNTGNYTIHSTTRGVSDKEYAGATANDALNMLSNLLRSYDRIKLDESFHLFFRVLSVPHMNAKRDSQRLRDPRSVVGASRLLEMTPNQRRLLNTSSKCIIRFAADGTSLEESCLLLAFAFGLLHKRHLSFLYNKKQYRDESQLYQRIQQISHKGKKGERALALAEAEVHAMCQLVNICHKGPHEMCQVLPKLCNYFSVQCHVYSNVGNALIYSHPPKFDDLLPQINFYHEKYSNEKTAHISYLKNKCRFFHKAGTSCLRCGKNVKQGRVHMCKKGARRSCFACVRIKVNPRDTLPYLDGETRKSYCIQRTRQDRLVCGECGVSAATVECLKFHKKSKERCGRGYVCPKCETFVHKGGARKRSSREDVLSSHTCHHVQCRMCRESHHRDDTEHVCKLQPQKPQTYYMNLGFFDFEAVQAEGSSNCYECMKRKKAYLEAHWREADVRKHLVDTVCDKHSGKRGESRAYHEANYCTCLYEDGERGSFSLVTFADPAMGHPEDCVIRENYLTLGTYLPDGESVLFTKNQKVSNFNRIHSSNITFPHVMETGPRVETFDDDEACDDLTDFFLDEAREDGDGGDESDGDFDNTHDDDYEPSCKGRRLAAGVKNVDLENLKKYQVLEKFWIFFTQPKFRNYTLLAHNASGYDSIHLSRSAFSNGLTPNIVTRGNKVLAMTIPSLNLVIMDSLQYTHSSLNKLAARYGLSQKDLFPHMFNREENYFYKGPVPSIDNFCSEGSGDKQRKDIADYITSQVGKDWEFKTEIHKYCLLDTEILCKAMIRFLKEWFEIQEIFLQYFPREVTSGEEKRMLHPFTPPFITFSGFIFGCYRYFESCNYDLRVIKDEKGCTGVKVSQGEMEYVLYEFERWGRRADFYSSFTSKKPRALGRIIPDFYIESEKIAGFYHGCLYHGHLDQNCSVAPPNSTEETLNFLGEKFGNLDEKFKRQCKELRERHGVKKIEIVWECEWERLKRGEKGQSKFREILDYPVLEHVQSLASRRPLERLSPRVALRGGRVDTFQFLWLKRDNPRRNLYYIDYNSL